MKKLIAPLVIVGVAGLYIGYSLLGSPSSSTNSTLFAAIPGALDQVMYIHVDQDILQLMGTIEQQSGYAGPQIATNLTDVQSLIVGQFLSGDETINLLFVEASKEASLEKLQSIGVIAPDEIYEKKQLSSNTWVYGDALALSYLASYKGSSLATLTGAQTRIQGMQSGTHNVGFLSRGRGGGANPLIAQFGKHLEYTMALSHLAPQNSQGKVIMQFTAGTIHAQKNIFVPQLASLVRDDALIYVEFADVLDALGITAEQVQMVLPFALAQYNPAFGQLLSNEQYANMAHVLNDHIGLALYAQPGNPLGMSLGIVFGSPEASTVLTALKPALRGLLETILGTGVLQEKALEGGYALTLGVPGLQTMFGKEPLLSMITAPKASGTALTLMMSPDSLWGKGITPLKFEDTSLATFMLDAKTMQKFNNSISDTSLGKVAGGQYFAQGIVRGNISLNEQQQQVVLEYGVY